MKARLKAAQLPLRGSACLLLLAACAAPRPPGASPGGAPAPAAAGVEQAAATITAEDMYTRIAFLASDELRGRATPSPGLETAAEYLASEFRRMGLQPAGDPGSFIQRYPLSSMSFDAAGSRIAVEGPQGGPALVYGRDFFAVPSAGDSVAAAAVYVGPLSRLADGFPSAVSGRIAIAALGPRVGMELIASARDAANAGATGLLLVLHPAIPAEAVGQIAANVTQISLETPIPTLGVSHANAQAIFRAAGLDPALLGEAAAPSDPVVLPRTTLRMAAPLRRVEHRVPNVVAVLPGSDPRLRDEYVVLSAHFDHVGVGRPDASGDSIYNGADDDASGTSVVLEVAEAFSRLGQRPARSVVFLAVSGEEKGLLGSLYFSDHPTVPIDGVVANINLDMVGRNAPDTVVAIGQEYTTLGPLARRIAQENPQLRLNIIADPDPAEQAFFRSDHVAFVRKDIPAIFLTSWLHEDYHRPSDEVDKIDTDKAARIARLVFRLAHATASSPERPDWLGDSLTQVREILKASPF